MKRIILWRERPIDVDVKLWNEIARNFQGEVLQVYSEKQLDERILTRSNNIEYKYYNKLLKYEDDEELLKLIATKDCVHIVFGFGGKTKKILNLLKREKKKFCIVAEMPKFYARKKFKTIKNILLRIKYYLNAFRYNRNIALFFAYGKDGVKAYSRLMFNKNNLFPIMYNSECDNVSINKKSLQTNIDILKCVYVGRFEFDFKGIDLIINAVKKLDSNKISLDLVGGYGKNVEEVRVMIDGQKNIKFLGTWKQSEVVEKMSEYDLCIVPSRCDGWNINVNHSIRAGIGCIATDRCVSYELLEYSHSGMVVNGHSEESIFKALSYVIENMNTVKMWKENAKKHVELLDITNMAKYLLSCIDYSFWQENTKDKPTPSWYKIKH